MTEPLPLTEEQMARAHALMLAADLGRGASPLGRANTKWVPWELVYLADYIIKNELENLDIEDAILLPRAVAAHAAVALAMSPSDEDQAVAREIETTLKRYEGDDAASVGPCS